MKERQQFQKLKEQYLLEDVTVTMEDAFEALAELERQKLEKVIEDALKNESFRTTFRFSACGFKQFVKKHERVLGKKDFPLKERYIFFSILFDKNDSIDVEHELVAITDKKTEYGLLLSHSRLNLGRPFSEDKFRELQWYNDKEVILEIHGIDYSYMTAERAKAVNPDCIRRNLKIKL